ncbi:zinc finger protein 292b isoform X2 [Nelusetta ayraudi]|uniref:zinc finger protein 292b isoform X2 n=1 Tax=Nelusetta ayraudi TaxID=303726 RepID=UPI003F6F3BD9
MEEFLVQEGPVLLEMRVKQLMKERQQAKATLLAKTCSQSPAMQGQGPFRQMYLVCLCATSEQEELMEELSKEDCRDALEMICNLESDRDEKAAFSLCSAFLTRQLVCGDTYCAWELTLFWSKLLKRLEPSEPAFLEQCRQMSLLSKTVYHILFLIKVIQSEIVDAGLPACVEMCVRALRMASDDGGTKATLCKTISCLLPGDLEVKRACQLTEFLLEPTVDAYYAVEALYNEPDQKLEEESMPVPNSLRCELLLVFKTQWPFDPEFWDWRTLKRNCLALMGEEASIVSSIDLLNDNGEPEEAADEDEDDQEWLKNVPEHVVDSAYEVMGIKDKSERKRQMKRLREKRCISARHRNWQAYMQYCVLCDKEFLGHRIVRHAQIHMSSGVYTCPICAQTFGSKDTLVPHVKSHVKQSCKERLTAMKSTKRLADAGPGAAPGLRAKAEGDAKEKADAQQQSRALASVAAAAAQGARPVLRCNEDNVCPVGNCRKSFKFFKNLVAHVKGHGDEEEAQTFLEMHRKKVVCQYCRRYFISVTHLNDHLQVHCGAKPYICIQLNCKESFLHNTELLVHRRTHPVFRARCMFPNCGKVFSEAFRLYDHEAHHYKTFTCSHASCGKVFHSQKQLDLHLERHAVLAAEEGPASAPQAPSAQHTTSLIQQMLQSNSRVKPQNSQESLDQKKQQISLESLLKHSKIPVVCLEQCRVDPELHRIPASYGQMRTASKSVAPPPVTSQVPKSQTTKDEVRPVHHGGQIESHSNSADLPQGPRPVFGPNNSFLSTKYQAPLPGQSGQPGPSVSQLLPPTAAPQPFAVNKLASAPATAASQTGTAPPAGQRERFHCPFENCTRNYSCYRSVTKHMRAMHSEFYERWKVERTKIKVTYAPVETTPPVQNQLANRLPVYGGQRQNVIQSAPFTNMSAGVTRAPVLPHPTSVQNHSPAALVMDGGVLPQPRSLPEASCQKWSTAPGSDLGQSCGTSQAFPADLQAMAQTESLGPLAPPAGPLPPPQHSGPSCSTMPSANRPVETLQSLLEHRSVPAVMSYLGGAKSVLQQAYTAQMQGSLAPASSGPAEMKAAQTHSATPSLDSEGSANRKLLHNGERLLDHDPEQQKQTRRNRRSKWPAIVRDGKFICCRCFRQFNSPKSLGGHLSKRVICKPYDESELNTELPLSFLDFLNSEPSADATAAQPPLPYGPLPPCQEKPRQPVGSGPPAGPQYPRVDLLGYGNGEGDYNAAKRLSAEPSVTDVFMHCPGAEPLFPSPCAPYGTGECLPGSSLAQRAENVDGRQKDSLYGAAQYTPPPCVDAFVGREYSDPLLSRILAENAPPSVPASLPVPVADLGKAFLSDSYGLHPAIQTPAANPDPLTQGTQLCVAQPRLPVSPDQLDAQRKATEQDVKKRLREQILAGDFQRRSNLGHSNSTDLNANSRNPVPSGPVFGPARGSQLRQDSCDAEADPSVVRANFASLLETSANVDGLPNTRSFTCFRETSAPQAELLSPTGALPNDVDVEPTQLTASQQQWMSEIQKAFERLDLVRETSHQAAPGGGGGGRSSVVAGHAASQQVAVQGSAASGKSGKAFVCEDEECSFSTSSTEALWRHLSKAHAFTLEMVNVVKKKYGQYAPFKCFKCSKNFTRNSNLRTHYKTAHQLSQEEIEELDLKRRKAKAAASAAVYSQASTAPPPAQSSQETKLWPQSVGKATRHNAACANASLPNNKYQTHASPLTPIQPLQAAPPQTNIKQPAANSQSASKPNLEVPKKTAEKRPAVGSASTSPYRPYRCVHQGCLAAFTIQHNLILHYRAVHQSALSALEVNKDQEHDDDVDEEEELMPEEEDEEDREAETPQISEFRCQVKDCSRVFQEIPNLLQHYVQLHKFGLDRVGIFLSTIKSGRFSCGYQGCAASFPTCWKYLGHVKEQHKNMFGKAEQLDCVSFRCEIEGCDRSYTTKSNLLRHFMKKHQDVCPTGLKNQRTEEHRSSKALLYPIGKTSNGKENIESNKKIVQKGGESKKESKENHWSNFGKPSLKSKSEASALCTKRFPLQYPCMIKGCESVMKSERNILKHYSGHGLSEKYVEQQRSYFIFCKKVPRQKCHSSRSDDSKSDNTSDLSDNDFDADAAVFDDRRDDSKPILRKRAAAAEVPAAPLAGKLSNEDSSDSVAVVKRKRGRPRKLLPDAGAATKRKKIPRTTKLHVAYGWDNESDSSSCHAGAAEEREDDAADAAGAQLASFNFKPMGFEMSFLQFLEQSSQSESALGGGGRAGDAAEPRGRTSNPNTKDTCVRFRNRGNIRSLNRVKVVIDRVFSGVADLMLKQLQDMQPTVVLGLGQ